MADTSISEGVKIHNDEEYKEVPTAPLAEQQNGPKKNEQESFIDGGTVTRYLSEVFQGELAEKSNFLTSSLLRICPEEFSRFCHLEQINTAMNEAITRQQCSLHEAWVQFNGSQDGLNVSDTSGLYSSLVLRLHIYNTYFNQRSGNPEIDSFSSRDSTDTPPPRWVLRIQGRLLDSPGDELQFQKASCFRMTSFFDRILVSRASETLIWDRSCQIPQPVTEKTFKEVFPDYKPMSVTSKVARQELAKPSKGCNAAEITDSTCQVKQEQKCGSAEQASCDPSFSERETYAVMDATISESVTRHLVDCDGIELCRCGYVEEDVTIVLFPRYQSPHYVLSPELASVVGFPLGSLCRVIHALWLRIRNASRSTFDLTCLTCDKTLQNLFRINEETFSFYQLPSLLAPHLHATSPIVLKHRIKVTGDYIDNEAIYDIHVDKSQLLCRFEPFSLSDSVHKHFSSCTEGITRNQSRDEISSENKLPPSIELLRTQFNPEDRDDLWENGSKVRLAIHECWNKIWASITRRNMLLRFAKNPVTTMHLWLTKPGSDSHQAFLEEYELADSRNDFYAQPWVKSAVKTYMEKHKKSFEELIKQTLQVSDPQQWATTLHHMGANNLERSNVLQSQNNLESEDVQKLLDSNVRIPVFTQVNRQTQADRYMNSNIMNRFDQYLSQYNSYVNQACSMPLNHFNSFSIYHGPQGFPGNFPTVAFPVTNPTTYMSSPHEMILNQFNPSNLHVDSIPHTTNNPSSIGRSPNQPQATPLTVSRPLF